MRALRGTLKSRFFRRLRTATRVTRRRTPRREAIKAPLFQCLHHAAAHRAAPIRPIFTVRVIKKGRDYAEKTASTQDFCPFLTALLPHRRPHGVVQAAALANPSRHGAGRSLRRGGRPKRLGAIHDGLGRPVWNNLPKPPQTHCHAAGNYFADLRVASLSDFKTLSRMGARPLGCTLPPLR